MKYIKLFENAEPKYQVGDYVICQDIIIDEDKENLIKLNKILSKNVGKIIHCYITTDLKYPYDVQFEFYTNTPTPEILKNYFDSRNCRGFNKYEIRKATPKEIDDFEMQKNTIKYNL